jgi:hypothetical protein
VLCSWLYLYAGGGWVKLGVQWGVTVASTATKVSTYELQKHFLHSVVQITAFIRKQSVGNFLKTRSFFPVL